MKKVYKYIPFYLFIIMQIFLPSCNQKDLYQNATSPIPDFTAPVPGNSGNISKDLLVTQVTLRWEKATDNTIPQGKLQYTVYISKTANIPTPEEAPETADLVQAWTEDISQMIITNLEDSTAYYYNVFVRDMSNNISKYNEGSVTTYSNTQPVPGNLGSLLILPEDITESSIKLYWNEAIDDLTSPEDLEYIVYKSTDPDINNLYEAEANINAEIVRDWTAGLITIDITGLDEAETYYFNVFVRDNIASSAYIKTMARTSDISAPVPGNSGEITQTNLLTTSVTINWTEATDNGTDEDEILYAVYYADNSDKVETLDNALSSDATRVLDWTRDRSTVDVSGLTQNTTYYFNVFVHDGNLNNNAAYVPEQVTTSKDGAPVPGNTGVITASNPLATSVTLNWIKADDSGSTPTPQTDLQYYICGSTQPNIAGTNDVFPTPPSSAWEVSDWTTNIDTFNVSSLNEATTYYFNVFVRDGDSNTAAYSMINVKTKDNSPPVPGNGGSISTSNLTKYIIILSWDFADDAPLFPAGTPQANLLYRVNRAANIEEINEPGEYANGTQITPGWTANIKSIATIVLQPNTPYAYNVFVKDESGNIAAYDVTSTSLPPANTVYMYSTPAHNGNLGGRDGADALCTEVYDSKPEDSKPPCSNWHAFISISESDSIAGMPLNFGVPSDWEIMGFTDILIDNNWGSMLDGSINDTLKNAEIITDKTEWWSGSDSEGEYDSTSANCTAKDNNQSFTDTKFKGRTGKQDSNTATWIKSGESTCKSERHVMCVCW